MVDHGRDRDHVEALVAGQQNLRLVGDRKVDAARPPARLIGADGSDGALDRTSSPASRK